MDFVSWSSTLLKLNGYEGAQNQQQRQQQAGLLSSSWPWISDPTNATRPALLLLDLAVLEAAAANHFWHPTSASSLAMANFMSSRIMDKQHQLSFGIDRILGNQIGVDRSITQVSFVSFTRVLVIWIVQKEHDKEEGSGQFCF